MKSELMRKFGVEVLVGAGMEIICRACGMRLGLHSGSKCPTISDWHMKDANEPDHDLEYHDKKLEGR